MPSLRGKYRVEEPLALRIRGAVLNEIYEDTLSIMRAFPETTQQDAIAIALDGAQRATEIIRDRQQSLNDIDLVKADAIIEATGASDAEARGAVSNGYDLSSRL